MESREKSEKIRIMTFFIANGIQVTTAQFEPGARMKFEWDEKCWDTAGKSEAGSCFPSSSSPTNLRAPFQPASPSYSDWKRTKANEKPTKSGGAYSIEGCAAYSAENYNTSELFWLLTPRRFSSTLKISPA